MKELFALALAVCSICIFFGMLAYCFYGLTYPWVTPSWVDTLFYTGLFGGFISIIGMVAGVLRQ